jgi:DNA replication protein DnaC
MSELAVNHDSVIQGANLLLFGASAVGKTHLASNLGYSLIEAGTRLKLYSSSALVQQLQKAKQSLKLQNALNKLDKYPALIIDDIGYVKKTEQETNVLFELIAHRYERREIKR